MTFPKTISAVREIAVRKLMHEAADAFAVQIWSDLKNDILKQVEELDDGRRIEVSFCNPVRIQNPAYLIEEWHLTAYIFIEDPLVCKSGEVARNPHYTWEASTAVTFYGTLLGWQRI